MERPVESRARRMWRAVEPIHAVTYFAPESKAACDRLGTTGWWMSYFALRGSPLGAASPELVTALFYNFHPALVARALPDAWAVAGPERFVATRLETVDAALCRMIGADVLASAEVAEAATIAREAALAAPTAGRALGAANAALDWPDEPHLVLWHAQTVLREQRGDGHVAALLTAGLDPVETLVVFAASGAAEAERLRLRRGWSEQEWAAAAVRLAERGILTEPEPEPEPEPVPGSEPGSTPRSASPPGPRAELTPAGRDLVADVEARTDALADVPWQAVGDTRAERLVELVAPLVAAIVAGEGFNPDNPMGLRTLAPSDTAR